MSRLLNPMVVVPMIVGMFGIAASSGATEANPASQEWFQGQPMRPVDPPPGVMGGGQDFGQRPGPRPMGPGGAGGPNAGISDFPDDQIHDWVVANARAAHARATLHRAERELDEVVRNAQLSFEQSKEYADAVAAEKQAYDAYTAERQRALQSVVNDPKYRAALELRDEMGSRLAHARATSRHGEVPHELVLAIASQKLQFASDAHNMESAALEKDDALRDLRQKMVQASARQAELRAHFDASIRNNAQVAQARRNLDDSRVALITAEAYLDAATVATTAATDYSYYRHRWEGLAGPQVVGLGPYGY